ncbi:hypothetical protein [Parvibium lacunae]|uniref:Morphogenetic protein n=1 Tax=Parvibium lacunae TaxID=1888893 RepID=A0A368L7Z3_9BURK|nr:hypothetical protein [Parvibium lacunae]RCS59746.1 hypothetical protein DU000_03290 [Parvibium lacunae]
MKERPILFYSEMVRAILGGRKTQTRRVAPISDLKIKRESGGIVTWSVRFTKPVKGVLGSHSGGIGNIHPHNIIASQFSPYGRPGDRLWVRETHCFCPRSPSMKSFSYSPEESRVVYGADDVWLSGPNGPHKPKMRPSIHMPRWASRITLEITGVRVERLQDISEADAISEGVERTVIGDAWRRYCNDTEQEAAGLTPCGTASASFCSLWESINGPESWDANPWVWVVEFKRVTP